ncbi:MAG: hypothetical protein ACK466_00495, partial [Pseudanabaena sp.]
LGLGLLMSSYLSTTLYKIETMLTKLFVIVRENMLEMKMVIAFRGSRQFVYGKMKTAIFLNKSCSSR